MKKADLIVLGGGPGGYLAAERAARAGKMVVLIEKRALGGTCLNEGCVPSKVLLNSAKLYRHALNGKAFGVTAENVKLDHEQVILRKDRVVRTLAAGVKAIMEAEHVTVVLGEGFVEGACRDGFIVRVNDEKYVGDKLILACGSVSLTPEIPGLAEGLRSGFVLTNAEALIRTALPEKLVVIGGGVIGLEMASYYAAAGVAVTVIEMLHSIAGSTEAEISEILLKACRKSGIKFKLGCAVAEVTERGVVYEEKGVEKIAEADSVLCAIGRRPCTEKIGLENLGIAVERGAVVTDEHLATNVKGVFAVGDINGKIMLAHTAYREAEVAVNVMLGIDDAMDYSLVPSVIYTEPEVAGIGETEGSATSKGIKTRSVRVPMNYSGRYLAEVERGEGICKLIVNTENDTVIGVHMIGSYVSEIIYGAELMIASKKPLAELQKLIFPHPTVTEVIREAMFM